nr:unnamed protein product [Callosobruchus analis]
MNRLGDGAVAREVAIVHALLTLKLPFRQELIQNVGAGCFKGGPDVPIKLALDLKFNLTLEIDLYLDIPCYWKTIERSKIYSYNLSGIIYNYSRHLSSHFSNSKGRTYEEIDELVDSLRNITLESSRLNQENMATQVNGEVQPITLQMLKMFVDTVPSFNAAPFKNEPPMDFGKRLQVLRSSLAQKLTLSEPSSVIRTAMLKQYEGVCLRAFIRGLPGPLQTIIRLKNPDSLERALTYVVEEQNFQYTQNIFKQRPNNFNTPRFPSQQLQPFNNNIRFQPPVQQSQQTFQSAQNFPSQPIKIQTVPVQRHFPTNREVFGPPKNANVFKPTGNPPSNHPQPMSVSTRNTFRPRAPQRQNHFRPSGPRNFSSGELFQIDQSNAEYEKEHDNLENSNTNIDSAQCPEN